MCVLFHQHIHAASVCGSAFCLCIAAAARKSAQKAAAALSKFGGEEDDDGLLDAAVAVLSPRSKVLGSYVYECFGSATECAVCCHDARDLTHDARD